MKAVELVFEDLTLSTSEEGTVTLYNEGDPCGSVASVEQVAQLLNEAGWVCHAPGTQSEAVDLLEEALNYVDATKTGYCFNVKDCEEFEQRIEQFIKKQGPET
jgi:hypothetical protein